MNTTHTQVYRPEKCEGKTIDAVAYDGTAVGFRFTDGTFLWLKAEGDDSYDCGASIEIHDRPGYRAAFDLEVITEEEYDRLKAEREARDAERERGEFERLRAKFEPGTVGGLPPGGPPA